MIKGIAKAIYVVAANERPKYLYTLANIAAELEISKELVRKVAKDLSIKNLISPKRKGLYFFSLADKKLIQNEIKIRLEKSSKFQKKK